MRTQHRLFKNAAANLARGGAIAAFSLLLPPFLVRHMPSAHYTVWLLVLQTAAYIGYFDFGLQIAVGRYIAFAEELKDEERRDAIYSTSFVGLTGACVLSCVLLAGSLWLLPHLFPGVPLTLMGAMRWTLLIVGGVTALGLPASVCNCVFIGLQRNEIPALTTGSARLLSAMLLVGGVLAGCSLVSMAVLVALPNLLAYAAQWLAMRRLVPGLRFKRRAVHRDMARELFHYCLAITVMSVSMLMVSGLDVILVGRFEYHAVIAYSLSASLIAIMGGGLYAVLNAIMPHAAGLDAQGSRQALGNLVVSSTRLNIFLLILTGLPAIIYAGPLLKLWLGPAYSPAVRTIMIILLLANMLRLTGAAYSIILVAAAQQTLIKVSPLAEGISNLAASILLGAYFGAVGVAAGTLIGAIVSVGAHLFYNMPRTHARISFSRHDLLWSGVALPLLCTSPLLFVGAWSVGGVHVSASLFGIVMALSLAASGSILFRSASAGSLAGTLS